ncbi:MAG: tRNA dihydrouridine synthase DusB [Acidobacteria bacterium]|nr:tRNA dihydrouridine synthase DusB [Acidobacteriota bacterium]
MPSIPQKLCFGPLELSPAVTLAPMAGVTDTVFRRFIRNLGGCGLIMTEFTSSHGILADDRRRKGGKKPHRRSSFNYLYFEPDEHPIVAQLFGSDPQVLADAARVVEDLGFDGVDMNFGCPVKKVVKCNGGSGLLRDLPLIEEILTAVRKAVSIPFTCKFRTGWDDDDIVCCEVGKIAEQVGLQGVALHGRTRAQGYSGTANWDWIAALKQSVSIPVVGNGDVFSPEDAVRMFEHTGCDGVMIGRAAASNPWIFRQIQQYVATGRYDEPTEADRYRMIKDYYELLVEKQDKISGEVSGKMKQFATYFTRGVRNGSQLRKAIYRAEGPEHVLETVDRFFEEQLVSAA